MATTVIYEGADISADVSISRAWLELNATGKADRLTITFNDKRNFWGEWRPKKGDTISVNDGTAKTGLMHVVSVRPESSLMTLGAISAPNDAVAETRWKSWQEVHFMQLATEVCGRHDLSLETYGATDHTYEYVEQRGESDLAFLAKRCAFEGYGLIVYDEKLIIYSGEYMDSQSPAGSMRLTPGDDYRILDDDFERYGSCKVTDGRTEGTFTAEEGNELSVVLADRLTDIGEAQRFARGLLRHKNRRLKHVRVKTGSFLDQYATGSLVDLDAEAAGSFSGPAFVECARFDFSARTTMLEMRPVITGY